MTKHKQNCRMAFGRKDATCPRCQELLNGAKPRESWRSKKEKDYQQFLRELKAHDCKKSRCGVVCTAFDY